MSLQVKALSTCGDPAAWSSSLEAGKGPLLNESMVLFVSSSPFPRGVAKALGNERAARREQPLTQWGRRVLYVHITQYPFHPLSSPLK